MTKLLFVLLGGLPLAAADAPNDAAARQAQRDAGFAAREAPYLLAPGDVVSVQYRYTPEYNQDASVQPDGCVSLPLFGQLKIGGMTVEGAQAAVRRAAAARLRDPEVTVLLRDFARPAFYILGEVNTPGRFEMRGPVTVRQAIAMGGGFKATARHNQVVLFRKAPNGMAETRLLNVKKMLAPAGATEDIAIEAGDVLAVPQSRIAKIERYVRWGSIGIYPPLWR